MTHTDSRPSLEIHYAEDWAALYVDGKLDQVGDTSNTEERALEVLGVTTVHNDAFMRGQSQRSGVADTLDEVATYSRERQERLDRAEALKAEAAQLLAQAAALTAKGC